MPAGVEAGMVRKRTFKDNAAVVPSSWRDIAAQRKTVEVWPQWTDPPALPSRKIGDARDDLRTVAGETIELLVPLSDENGVGLEGVNLRITAWPYRPHHDITATLEISGGRSYVTIARVDGWPADPHMKTRARGHPGCGHIPREIEGHHVHRFQDNAKLGREAFGAGRDGNLPLAVPVNGSLKSFRDYLRVVGEEFNIEGLESPIGDQKTPRL
jgi:hypothetical protein